VLTIVGGGVIGIEYACIAAALDIPVTLIERRPRILDFVDQQIVEALSYHMRSQGVTFRLGEEVEEVTKSSEGKVCAKLKSGKQIWSDALLYAVVQRICVGLPPILRHVNSLPMRGAGFR
jgi:NAD(P) transhydrogenase